MGMKPTHMEGQLYTDRTKQVISTDISSETMKTENSGTPPLMCGMTETINVCIQ